MKFFNDVFCRIISMKRIQPFESVRFLAFLAIFFHHLSFLSTDPSTKPLYSYLYENYMYFGYSALGFFLVLSGFVITLQYGNKIINGLFSYKTFLIRRFIRIYPIHIITLLLSLPLVLRDQIPEFWGKFILNSTLLHGFYPRYDYIYSFNSVSWSLSILMLGYILAPSIISLMLISNRKNTLLPFIILTVITVGMFIYASFQPSIGDTAHISLYISPLFRIFEFIAGAVLGRIIFNGSNRKSENGFLSATLLECISILFIAASFLSIKYVPYQFRWNTYMLPSICLFIFIFSRSAGLFSRILSIRPIALLGSISFEFFMIHVLAIRFTYDFLSRALYFSIEQTVIVSLLTSFAGALLLNIVITRPLRKLEH